MLQSPSGFGHIGDIYTTTIHEPSGATATGGQARAKTEGITIDDLLKLLGEVQQAARHQRRVRLRTLRTCCVSKLRRLTACAPLGFRSGPFGVPGTPAGTRRHGDQRTCSVIYWRLRSRPWRLRLAGRGQVIRGSSHENAERVSGGVGEHIQRLILVVGAVEQFSGTES